MKARVWSSAIIVLLGSAASSPAQDPGTPPPSSAPRVSVGSTIQPADYPGASYTSPHRYRSRTAPRMPQADPDADPGFRNPGGVGRTSEYYPPGNQFEQAQPSSRAAGFDNGPSATSRQSQMAAQQVGIQRSNALQQHIDRYGAPSGLGYGYGFGFGYGAFR